MPDGLNNSSRSAIGRPLKVFRHRPFLIFWIGACISNTGNWTENAAQSWAVTSQTIPNAPAPSRAKTLSIYDDIREGLKFVWTSPGTRRLTVMGMVFMFLAAPLQGLLPVFAQSVLKGGPGLFGLMLSAIGLGSIIGAFLLPCIPSYYGHETGPVRSPTISVCCSADQMDV
jgi:hypothetical protein